MIRAYIKKPITFKNLDYQKLFYLTVKKKYFSLILGLFSVLTISALSYNLFLKNILLNIVFKFPVFKSSSTQINNKVKKEVKAKTYTTEEGDDLWHVAEKFYGSGFNAYDISVANKISDSSNLAVGMKLVIPVVTPRQPTVGEISAVTTDQVTYIEDKYVVQPGDSLSIIAQKVYGDIFAWPTIMNANGLTSPDSIEAGMVLIIPR